MNQLKQIQVDEALKIARQGVSMNNASVLAAGFATLDALLRDGAPLPADWMTGERTISSPVIPEGIVHDLRIPGEQ